MLFARDIEVVKDFVLGRLEDIIDGMAETTMDKYDAEVFYTLMDVKENIELGTMLTKDMATQLNETLEMDMQTAILNRYPENLNISAIDELSIYSDAWYIYCRPGTYQI